DAEDQEAGEPHRVEPEGGENVDEAALEVEQVEADIGCGAEVEDRIADQLAGTVIGDIPAPIDVETGDAARRKFCLVKKDMIAGATSSDGVGVWMFEQHRRVGDQAR